MKPVKTLTTQEIDNFIQALNKNSHANISYNDIEKGLDAAYEELAPKVGYFQSDRDSNIDQERRDFLKRVLGTENNTIPVSSLKELIESWEIPSLEPETEAAKDQTEFMKNLPLHRRLRAWWEVHGPVYCFIFLVGSLTIGFAIWQCVIVANKKYQAAFGPGIAAAKFFAGGLYATLFFLVLSMSRWTGAKMRKIPYVSRVINWDLHHAFHVKISILALILATGHALSHLGGTFTAGSSTSRQPAVGVILIPKLGENVIPRSYIAYIRELPGWTGITALGSFYIMGLLSTPWVRNRSYETFQIGHLLMFPFIGLLLAHGSLKLFHYPMLGFFLTFPTLIVFLERAVRTVEGFHGLPAELEVLDGETVCITVKVPKVRYWQYAAGQYVFLQVPRLSFWQWHPFTISECVGRSFKLHVKTDGNWTSKLRELPSNISIGVDGPYGAPAQRFYQFDQTIIIGSGIGVTPFSGILRDLQAREDHAWTRPVGRNRFQRKSLRSASSVEDDISVPIELNEIEQIAKDQRDFSKYRRVDFHWILREGYHIQWFSSLLNTISTDQRNPSLDIRIYNYLTYYRKNIETHVFRWLLEKHRTVEHPYSCLTGLLAPTQYGRPDFHAILSKHYDDMRELFTKDTRRKRKVGVFFCGAPTIGKLLADLCHQMTLRGQEDSNGIEYHFMIEVSG